jgi:N-carbamoylputrescine amidase
MLRAAMIQQQCTLEKMKNIEKAIHYIKVASSNGAKIICLQELFNNIYFCHELNTRYYEWAEPIPGPTTDILSKVAQEENVVIIAPIYEREIHGELYNTAPVIGPNGEIIGKYRKMSIPFVTDVMGLTKPMKGMEKFYFKPGNLGFPIFKTPFGVNIGIMICYDRHFPEAARALALAGADIVFVPSATASRTKYLWEIELRAHAIANIYYVGGVNRVNKDIGGSENHFYGSSIFVSPRGEIIAQAGTENDEIIYADLDLSLVSGLRNEWSFFRDRRPDAYAVLCR